jgi:hypothetical protein
VFDLFFVLHTLINKNCTQEIIRPSSIMLVKSLTGLMDIEQVKKEIFFATRVISDIVYFSLHIRTIDIHTTVDRDIVLLNLHEINRRRIRIELGHLQGDSKL